MDLLRLDTVELGPIYVSADSKFILSREGENTNVGILLAPGVGKDVTLLGDVDEVAAMFETNYHACRIYRVN